MLGCLFRLAEHVNGKSTKKRVTVSTRHQNYLDARVHNIPNIGPAVKWAQSNISTTSNHSTIVIAKKERRFPRAWTRLFAIVWSRLSKNKSLCAFGGVQAHALNAYLHAVMGCQMMMNRKLKRHLYYLLILFLNSDDEDIDNKLMAKLQSPSEWLQELREHKLDNLVLKMNVNFRPSSSSTQERLKYLHEQLQSAVLEPQKIATIPTSQHQLQIEEKKHSIQLLADKIAYKLKDELVHQSTVNLLADFMHNLLCRPTGRRCV